MSNIESFFSSYLKGVKERGDQGIPPLPFDKEQTLALCEALQTEKLDPEALIKPGLKDTVLVPGQSSLEIIAYMDNPGRWMAHCHILEHAELGMMSEIAVTPRD